MEDIFGKFKTLLQRCRTYYHWNLQHDTKRLFRKNFKIYVVTHPGPGRVRVELQKNF